MRAKIEELKLQGWELVGINNRYQFAHLINNSGTLSVQVNKDGETYFCYLG